MGRETFDSDNAKLFIGRLLDALREERAGRAKLQDRLFASKTKVLNYLRYLHGDTGAKKRIYICGYDDLPNGGRSPVYAVGNLPDAPPRGSRTMSERWQAIKADPDKHKEYKRRLIKYARKKGIPPRKRKPVSPFAALGL